MNHIAENLRYLCGFERSVSAVCRATGFNRQQFSKYLSGASRPSPYNLQRVCDYFGIRPADIHLPHQEFTEIVPGRKHHIESELSVHRHLFSAFWGHTRALRPYLGFYLTHCYSISRKNHIMRAFTHLYESDGLVVTKSIERFRDPQDHSLFLSKYDGLGALLCNRIFIVEYQSHANDAIVETMLYPRGRGQLLFLRGTTFGISSNWRQPYASPSVWQYLGPTVEPRTTLRMVGMFSADSGEINSEVRRLLAKQARDPRQFPCDIER